MLSVFASWALQKVCDACFLKFLKSVLHLFIYSFVRIISSNFYIYRKLQIKYQHACCNGSAFISKMNTFICIRGRDRDRGRHSNCWHHKHSTRWEQFQCVECMWKMYFAWFLDLGRFEWKDFTTSWLDSLSRIFYNQKHANAKVNGFSHRTQTHALPFSTQLHDTKTHRAQCEHWTHFFFWKKHSAHENSNNNYAHIVLLFAKLCQ